MSDRAQGELPAVLLALPGLMAAWLATRFTGEGLRRTSLATITGVFVAGSIAVASVALALAKIAHADVTGTWQLVWIEWSHPMWSILMVVSAAAAIDLTARTAARVMGFAFRSRATERWFRVSL